MNAQERSERIKVLENALSLLSDDATEADKALVKGELQVLTEERDKDIAEANARIRYIQEQIDSVNPVAVLLQFAEDHGRSPYGDPRYTKEQRVVIDLLNSLVNNYKYDKNQTISRIQKGMEGVG